MVLVGLCEDIRSYVDYKNKWREACTRGTPLGLFLNKRSLKCHMLNFSLQFSSTLQIQTDLANRFTFVFFSESDISNDKSTIVLAVTPNEIQSNPNKTKLPRQQHCYTCHYFNLYNLKGMEYKGIISQQCALKALKFVPIT